MKLSSVLELEAGQLPAKFTFIASYGAIARTQQLFCRCIVLLHLGTLSCITLCVLEDELLETLRVLTVIYNRNRALFSYLIAVIIISFRIRLKTLNI